MRARRPGHALAMPSYTGTVETSKAPDEVFDWLAAFEHTSEWDPNCERAERLTPGEVSVGTRFRLVFSTVGSMESELEYEVVEFDRAGRRMKLRGGNDRIASEDVLVVEPADGGAKVTYSADLGMKGAAKVVEPLVGIGFHKASKSAEEGLADRLSRPLA